jgi:hypothetical protein
MVNAYTKYVTLKSAIEDLFGSDAWYALKESNHLGTWRKYAERTLRAVEIAVKDTVEVYDEEWLSELCECLARGIEAVRTADAIDDVVGVMAGTLIEVSFLQIGLMPRRKGRGGKYPAESTRCGRGSGSSMLIGRWRTFKRRSKEKRGFGASNKSKLASTTS